MSDIYISDADSVETNIEKVLNFVIEEETQKGHSIEEIKFKYTHGWCGQLASLIETVLRIYAKQKASVCNVDMNLPGKIEHSYIKVSDKERVKKGDFFAAFYYDILGKHDSKEFDKFTADPYFIDEEEIKKHKGDDPATRKLWDEEFQQITKKLFDLCELNKLPEMT